MQGILFDFDNTLVSTSVADEFALERVKETLVKCYPEDDVEHMASEYKRLVSESGVDPSGIMNPHDWRVGLWQSVINQRDCSANDGEVQAAEIYEIWRCSRLEKIKIPDEVGSVLEILRKTYRLALVTNSEPAIQKQKLSACEIERFFDVIVISGEQPRAKPHASIFHTACSLISVVPEECIMVGDNLKHDIQGGLNAGLLATVWVRLAGRVLNEGDPIPHYTVDSVVELPRVLQDLNS